MINKLKIDKQQLSRVDYFVQRCKRIKCIYYYERIALGLEERLEMNWIVVEKEVGPSARPGTLSLRLLRHIHRPFVTESSPVSTRRRVQRRTIVRAGGALTIVKINDSRRGGVHVATGKRSR